MTARVTVSRDPAGAETFVLENDALRLAMVPGGGHVFELIDRVTGRDLLWHNPRTALRPAPYGAWFDDWWSGGWDEIFPSGDQGTLHAESMPYMGELWCLPWTVRPWTAGDEAGIVASAFGTIAPARFERRLALRADEPVLRVQYRIENLDVRALPFTWGIHPAFVVTSDHRIDLPAGEMLVGVSSDASMGAPGQAYRWPSLPDAGVAGGLRDMRTVRPRADAVFGGHWATGLAAGWVALTDTSTRRGVAIGFDREVFPDAWLWQVYGGWRGHHHLALEPWTGHPQRLDDAIAAGSSRLLPVGGVLETEVAFVLYGELEAVASVEREGDRVIVR